jgi:hypothetical protein
LQLLALTGSFWWFYFAGEDRGGVYVLLRFSSTSMTLARSSLSGDHV